MLTHKLLPVAQISKLYGSEGEVVVNLFDNFPDEVDFSEPLFVYCDKLAVPLFLKSFKQKGSSKAVVAFDDLETTLRISEFLSAQLFAKPHYVASYEEEQDDELYFEDLVDYQIYDLNTGRKGLITNFVEHKINPIFMVDFSGIEVLVPACDEIIKDIYVDAKVVEAEIPDGLYEFYAQGNS